MKKIILTGGGTAGHVTPNIALLPRLKELQYDIHYIGSYNGIEKELISQFGIPYHGISTGKLRRYFSVQNFTDPFRVIKGMGEARKLIKILEPDVIFSKGGFVTVPVVIAAKRCKIPAIIHESDMTPGLANKICIPSAARVCCNFPETLQYLPKDKAVLTGSPIRRELLTGDRLSGLQYTHLSADKPIILVKTSMKRFILMAAAAALLAIPAAEAQKVNKEATLSKLEKSDADIANPKKNAKAATWINRGRVYYDAGTDGQPVRSDGDDAAETFGGRSHEHRGGDAQRFESHCMELSLFHRLRARREDRGMEAVAGDQGRRPRYGDRSL